MPEQVFFYGTLRTGFNRTTGAGIDAFLKFAGRGWINGKAVRPRYLSSGRSRKRRARVGRGLRDHEIAGCACRRALDRVEAIGRPNQSAASTTASACPPRWTTAAPRMCGCIFTTRRSDERRELPQAITSNICNRGRRCRFRVPRTESHRQECNKKGRELFAPRLPPSP